MKKVVRVTFNIALIIVFVLIVLISVKTISNLKTQTIINQINETIEDQELIIGASEMLEAGIGIIGLGIAVWAGLNISSAISKNDAQELIEELEDKNKKINEICASMENINKNEFLKALLETSDDIMSIYWYDKFKDLECPQDVLCKLVIIEKLFSQMYHIHMGINRDNEYLEYAVEDMQRRIDETFNYIVKNRKSLEIEYSLDTIQNYLIFRESDGFFYKGYIEGGEEKAYKTYKNAIDGYLDVAENISCDFLKYPDIYKENEIDRDNAKVFCYFANRIGEVYSKMLQKCKKHKGIEDTIKKAEYYCSIAIKCSEEYECECEIYYRNLGCVYERIDNLNGENTFIHSEKILDNYGKALKFIVNRSYIIENITEKVYQVYLSYIKRCIEEKLQIRYDSYEDIKNIDNVIDNLSVNNKIEVQDLIEKAIEVSSFGIKDNIRKSLNIVMYGFSNAYIALLKFTKNIRLSKGFEEEKGIYLERAKWAVDTLEFLNITDTYSNQLRKLYEALEERYEDEKIELEKKAAEKKESIKKESTKEKEVGKKESPKKESAKKEPAKKKESTKGKEARRKKVQEDED